MEPPKPNPPGPLDLAWEELLSQTREVARRIRDRVAELLKAQGTSALDGSEAGTARGPDEAP